MASISPVPKLQFFYADGSPLVGGLLYSYDAGTTTPLETYADYTGTILNTNPVVLDSRGEASVWLGTNNYKLTLKDSMGVEIWTIDQVGGIATQQDLVAQTNALNAALAALAASGGSSTVGFIAAGGTAVATTVQAKLREWVSVKDFGAMGDGTTDDSVAIQYAVTECEGTTLYFPSGTYIVGTPITVPNNITMVGDLGTTTLKLKTKIYSPSSGDMFVISGVSNVSVIGINGDGNKGNIGSTRNPFHVIYQSDNITFSDCSFANCEGITLNFSDDVDNIMVKSCSFTNCGGNKDGSDGYRWQAVAFSGGAGGRSSNIKIVGCSFSEVGLDCISLSDCDNVVVADNASNSTYTFLFNTPDPRYSTNLTVTGNVIANVTQAPLTNTVNPIAIDLPNVRGATISGNTIRTVDQAGIGIFTKSADVVVTGNTLVDCGQRIVSWCGGICVGAGNGEVSEVIDVVISGNLIVDNLGVLDYGVLVESDVTNVFISRNEIRGVDVSRYGYFTYPDIPSPAVVSALTTNTPISGTTMIDDVDFSNVTITNWRKTNTLTGYYFNGTKVVGAQGAAIANATDAASAISQLNLLLATCRTHGLIAT